ncbi:MAG: hypothetical protein RL208_449, partial [Pseudomonadota bacterium]
VKPEDLKTFFTNVRNENIKNYLDQVALVELGFTGDKNDEKSTQGNYPYSNDEKKRADTNSKAFANTNLDALGNDYFNHLVAKFPFLEKLPPFDDRKKNEIKDAVYKPFENVGLENYKFSIATVNEAQYRPDEDLIKNLNGLLYPQKKYDSSFGSNVQFSTDETHTSKEALKLKLENIELYQGRISAINIIHDVPLKKSGDVNSGYRNSYTKFYKLGDNFEINLHLPEELSIEEEEMLSAFILKHKEVFALQCNNERYKEIAKTAITLEQNNEVQTERCRNFKDLFYSLFGIKYQSAIKNAKNVNVNGVNTLHTNISLEKPNDALSIRYILEAALENQASHINNLEITLDKKNDLEKQLAKIIKKRTDGKITKDNIPIDTLTLNYTSISSEFTNDDQVKLKSYIDQLCSLGFKELNIKINVPGFSAGVDNFESVFNAFKNSLNNKQTKVVFDIFNNKKEKASMAAAGAGAVGTGVYKAVKIEEVAGEGARGEKELKKAIDSLNNTSHADGKIEVEVEQNQEQEEEQEQEQEEEQEQESSLEIKEEDLITRENIASFYDDKNNKKIPLSPDVRSKIELFVLDNKLGCRKTFGSSNQERFLRRLYDRIVGHEKKNKGLIFDKKITSITSRAASILITKFAQRNFDGNLCKEALPQGFYFVKKGDKLILDYDARKVSVNNRYGLRPKLKNTECKYDEDLLDIFNKNLRERGIDTIKNNSFINYIEPDNYASFFFRIIDILDIIKKRNKKITPEQQTQIRDYFLLGEIPLDTDDSIYYAVKYEGFDNISPEMIIRDDKSIKKKDNQLSYKVTLTELQDYLNKAGDKADLKTLQALFLRHIATPVKEGEPKINIKFIEAREIMQFQGMQDLYASVNALAVNDDKKQKAANIIKLLITFPIIENVKSIKTKIEAIINNNAITLSSKSFEALQESNPSLDDILNLSLIGVHKSNKQPLDAMLKHKNFKKIDWSVFKIVFHNLNIIKNSNVIENKLKYIGKVLLNKTCSENDKVKKIIACSFYTGETPDNFVVSDADFNKIANKRLNVNAVIPNNLGDINDNDVNIESINGSNSDFCFFNIQEIKSKKTNDNINDEHFFKLQFINAFKLKGMVFAPSEMRRLESICTLLYAKRAVIEECRTSIINQGKNEKDKKSISDCLTFFKPIYEKMPDRALEIITLFLNDNELKANIEHIDRFYRFIKPLSFDKELFLKFCNLWKMIIAKGNVKENKNSKEIEKLKSFSNVYNSKYLSHEEKLKALDVESHVSDCILKIKEIEEGLKKERVDYDTEIFKDLLKAIVKQSNVKQRIYFNIITKLAELAKAPELTKFTLELIEILNRKSLEENFDIDYVDTFIKQIVIDKGDKQKKVKLFQSNTQKIFKSAIVSDKNKPANIIPKNVIFINQINDPLKNTIIIDKDN